MIKQHGQQVRVPASGNKTHILVLSALLIALGVACASSIWFPVGVAKAFPVQHAINVIAGVLLGPGPAVVVAFVIGLLRNLLGLGTVFAFPGGMIGAFLAGLLYRYARKDWAALIGEVTGTGLIGALASFPIARFIMGKEIAALFFVGPFAISSVSGAIIAYIVLQVLRPYRRKLDTRRGSN